MALVSSSRLSSVRKWQFEQLMANNFLACRKNKVWHRTDAFEAMEVTEAIRRIHANYYLVAEFVKAVDG